MPYIVLQLSIFPDSQWVLRIKSKFGRWKEDEKPCYFPVLLSKHSPLTEMIIQHIHVQYSHIGCYSLLFEMRRRYWIPHYFTVVKKVLKNCVTCKRFKEQTVKLNQSPYRDFRVNPPKIPFNYTFLDHFGPFNVIYNQKKTKIWILCITCMWSRAINLKICLDLTVKEFLRAFQIHCYEYGTPSFVLSDLGSQIVSAGKLSTS